MRLSASCVAISLDPDVTVRTQAVYPRLLTRRTSTRLLFYLTPRRDCLVSHRSRRLQCNPKDARSIRRTSMLQPLAATRLCGSPAKNICGSAKVYGGNPSVKFYDGDGRYPLRCPPEPGLSSLDIFDVKDDHFLPALFVKDRFLHCFIR